jgi:hypothetical protein
MACWPRPLWSGFPITRGDRAEAAGCARSTVYKAIRALEQVSVLSSVNRIKSVREFVPRLFGNCCNDVARIRVAGSAFSRLGPGAARRQGGACGNGQIKPREPRRPQPDATTPRPQRQTAPSRLIAMQAGFKRRDNPHLKRCPHCGLKALDFFDFFGTRSKTRLYCRACYRFADMLGRKLRSLKPHRSRQCTSKSL